MRSKTMKRILVALLLVVAVGLPSAQVLATQSAASAAQGVALGRAGALSQLGVLLASGATPHKGLRTEIYRNWGGAFVVYVQTTDAAAPEYAVPFRGHVTVNDVTRPFVRTADGGLVTAIPAWAAGWPYYFTRAVDDMEMEIRSETDELIAYEELRGVSSY